MGVGATAFIISFLLVAVQRSGASYWAFTFPSLAIVVVGTDLEFNVVNVNNDVPTTPPPTISLTRYVPDVRRVLVAQVAAVHRQLRLPNHHQIGRHHRSRHLRRNFRQCL